MVNPVYYKDEIAVKKSCEILKAGGIIVYPTDTLYGFGCDAKNNESIKKINALKNRTSSMSVLVNSNKNIRSWLDVKDYVKDKAVDMLNEGATIIVPVKINIVSKLICGLNNSLGIRISNHPFCERLTSLYPNPITTTSVNLTKNPPMTTPLKIYEKFSNSVDLIIEDGIIKGKGSTIKVYKSNNTWEKIR